MSTATPVQPAESVERAPFVESTARPTGRPSIAAPAAPEKPTRLGIVSSVLTVLGVVALGFAVFALWGTAVLQQRDQNQLRSDLAERFVVDRATADADVVSDGETVGGGFGEAQTDADGAATTDNAPEELGPVGTGDALALLRIPALGLDQVVIEGSGAQELRMGPGHLRGTPRPGQKGNVVIAGKRTTYGAPFGNIDQLEEGDQIEVGTATGLFVYEVVEVDRLEPDMDEDVIEATEDNRLTLISAHPRHRADERLVVVAEFAGQDEGAPLRSIPAGLEPGADELGTGRDATAGTAVMLFGLLLVAAGAAFIWARRRWSGWAVWVVFMPILTALSVLAFESMLRWFPSTI